MLPVNTPVVFQFIRIFQGTFKVSTVKITVNKNNIVSVYSVSFVLSLGLPISTVKIPPAALDPFCTVVAKNIVIAVIS